MLGRVQPLVTLQGVTLNPPPALGMQLGSRSKDTLLPALPSGIHIHVCWYKYKCRRSSSPMREREWLWRERDIRLLLHHEYIRTQPDVHKCELRSKPYTDGRTEEMCSIAHGAV